VGTNAEEGLELLVNEKIKTANTLVEAAKIAVRLSTGGAS
jgi:succinyl-CoA synthetase beta subunit